MLEQLRFVLLEQLSMLDGSAHKLNDTIICQCLGLFNSCGVC